MSIAEELYSLEWPDEFIVEYTDGTVQRLLRGRGVTVLPPSDDVKGIGALIATIPPKHPSSHEAIGMYIPFNLLQAIRSLDGQLLWTQVQ
jgi:DNA-binding transcriptional LysR family regulator